MTERFDVAIVGYGPVGQLLAILLGQRGWRVGVFEKQPAAYPLPRAVHFDHEIGRVLQAAGIADEVRGRTESSDVYEWRNATGATLLRFESKAAGLSGWPDANMFAQPEIERLLDQRARTIPSVVVRRGAEVVAINPGAPNGDDPSALRGDDAGAPKGDDTDAPKDDSDAAGVRLTIAGADGAWEEVAARYVVGCDGANSFVRSALGATVTDLGFFFDWLIVDVLPNAPKVWRPLNVQVCDPVRPTTLVSGGPGRRRWEFMRLPGEELDELNRAETAWRLLAPWDVTPENARLERHVVYRFQARWVDTWRQGRLLLAGDAAHQMPPFAGQGMCSGLRDAANLAWKLDLILGGTSPEVLLDTYATERIPHVSAIIDFSMALGKVICIADPAEAAARDAVMVSATESGQQSTPPPPLGIGPGLVRSGDPHAGKLFLQGRVQHAGVVGLFDDVVGRGWTLLSVAGDALAALDPALVAWFASLGGIGATIGGDGPIRDLDGAYAQWFTEHGVAVVLQRPDFYIFGTATTVTEVEALVAALRTSLSNP
ncbi:MAG: bifunctional 3-(3-hydroxy-phenyl)propionate/3-hydroxycinnamic acid hydroxylase [Candidatus Binatia bacterium]